MKGFSVKCSLPTDPQKVFSLESFPLYGMLCSYIATRMYVCDFNMFQEVVEEPATDIDGDSDSGGSVVDSMEACEYSIA